MKSTKRVLPIVFVLALMLGLASQAFAATAPTPQAFTCLGKVTAVNQKVGTVTVTVTRASPALQGSLGQSLTLTVTQASALSAISHGATSPVKLGAVPVGDLLAASGSIDATSSTALTYDVGKATVWQPSLRTRFFCRGTITSVDLQANALVVHVASSARGLPDFNGKDATIDVPASAKLYVVYGRLAAATTIGQLTAGDVVYATGFVDRGNASAPVLTAGMILAAHVAPISRLTWFSCTGKVGAIDEQAGTVTVTVIHGTLAVHAMVGGELTLTVSARSVIRTLVNGVVTTVNVADLALNQSLVAVGTIDHSMPSTPVYDIGRAFVW